LKNFLIRIKKYYLNFEKKSLIFLISFGIGGYLLFNNINSNNYLILIFSIFILYIPFFDKIKFGNIELSKDIKDIKDDISKISNKIQNINTINNNYHYNPTNKDKDDVKLDEVTKKLKINNE